MPVPKDATPIRRSTRKGNPPVSPPKPVPETPNAVLRAVKTEPQDDAVPLSITVPPYRKHAVSFSDVSRPWKHPDELQYIRPVEWDERSFVLRLLDNGFSVPPRPPSSNDPWVKITGKDGQTTVIPRGYRVPLMFASKFQWESLRLVLSSVSRAKEWEEYKFDILHVSRLCSALLREAREAMDETGMDTTWRSATFDRALTRYFRRWLVSREEFVRDFWFEYTEEEYMRDVLKNDWTRWSLKGHKGFKLTPQEIEQGISLDHLTKGLTVTEDSVFWKVEHLAQDASSTTPYLGKRKRQPENRKPVTPEPIQQKRSRQLLSHTPLPSSSEVAITSSAAESRSFQQDKVQRLTSENEVTPDAPAVRNLEFPSSEDTPHLLPPQSARVDEEICHETQAELSHSPLFRGQDTDLIVPASRELEQFDESPPPSEPTTPRLLLPRMRIQTSLASSYLPIGNDEQTEINGKHLEQARVSDTRPALNASRSQSPNPSFPSDHYGVVADEAGSRTRGKRQSTEREPSKAPPVSEHDFYPSPVTEIEEDLRIPEESIADAAQQAGDGGLVLAGDDHLSPTRSIQPRVSASNGMQTAVSLRKSGGPSTLNAGDSGSDLSVDIDGGGNASPSQGGASLGGDIVDIVDRHCGTRVPLLRVPQSALDLSSTRLSELGEEITLLRSQMQSNAEDKLAWNREIASLRGEIDQLNRRISILEASERREMRNKDQHPSLSPIMPHHSSYIHQRSHAAQDNIPPTERPIHPLSHLLTPAPSDVHPPSGPLSSPPARLLNVLDAATSANTTRQSSIAYSPRPSPSPMVEDGLPLPVKSLRKHRMMMFQRSLDSVM